MPNQSLVSIFLIFFILVFYGGVVLAEKSFYAPDFDYFKSYPLHTYQLAVKPLSWEQDDWLWAGGIAGATLVLFALDESIQDWSQENKNNFTKKVAKIAKPFGDGNLLLPLSGGVYLWGLMEKNPRMQKAALNSVQSFFAAGIFSEIVKTLFQRHRPSTGNSYDTFEGPGWPRKHQSFSSGHACVAFAVGTVFAEEFSDYPAIPEISYSIATLTALSRVHDNDHWASDVFFGSAIGYFTSRGVMALNEESKNWAGELKPFYSGDNMGLGYYFSF